MTTSKADVVICGAGMAGIAVAYHLSVRNHVARVVLVDERTPMTLTSDKGTAAYRNWFPGPGDTMVRFMNRSIDLLEEINQLSGHAIALNRRGYIYLTANPAQIPAFRSAALDFCARGGGEFREHPGPVPYTPAPPDGWRGAPDGADLITDPEHIQHLFPSVAKDVRAILHLRRCGFFDAVALGDWLLSRAFEEGLSFRQSHVESVSTNNNQVQAIHLASGETIETDTFVVAAGPYLPKVASLLGLTLPVYNELHAKITFDDYLHLIPHDAGLMLWNDPQFLPWSESERNDFESNSETRWLLEEFPAGVHFRPRVVNGKDSFQGLWTYEVRIEEPTFPLSFEPHHGEVILRGLARMIPGLSAYFGQANRGLVDGGYYCKTSENRPLIGPLPVNGSFVVGALSGFGVMASQAAAELVSAYITGNPLPDYAPYFSLSRYQDPEYLAVLEQSDARAGQL